MKKTCKRLGAIFLAMAMAVSVLCTGAMADETPTETNTVTVTVPSDLSDHTFVAYQIFSGTQADNDTKLASVEWGSGIDSTKFLDALVSNNVFASGKNITANSSAADVAAALNGVEDKSETAKKFAKLAFENKKGNGTSLASGSNTLAKGYYLIVDTTATDDGTDVAKNTALLQVTNNITIEAKTGIPTVDKKVNGKEYDSANIGDEVTFTLTGKLPDNYEDFDKYVYEFQDTLSNGLDFVTNSVTVTVGDKTVKNVTTSTDSAGYYVESPVGTDTHKLNIHFEDLTKITDTNDNAISLDKDSTIVVTYKAKLNSNAVVGKDGNTNEVKLKYSNDPNGNGTGTTTPDIVKVFTLKVTVDKVKNDVNGDALEGAGFTLYKKNAQGTYEAVKVTFADNKGTVDPNGATEEIKGTDLTHFVWSGLGEGEYKLVETTVPDGYNKADDIIFTISITTTGEKANMVLNSVSATKSFTSTTEEDGTEFVLNTKVVNNAGSQLPSTGGMGTTLFYVIGGALMAGAAIVLVIKKKRSSAE